MLLAVDIGNTNSVFAVYDGGDLLASWRLQTKSKRTLDEYAAILKQLFDLKKLSFDAIEDVICSSVVPDANRHIERFCSQYLSLKPIFVTHDLVNIEVDLPQPGQVGADRLVNAVAICNDYDLPAVIIDFGTATTFDVIDAKGRYSGGAIAPGIQLSIEALNRAAAKLPKVSVVQTKRAIAKSTDEAIQTGIYWGYVGLIEGILKQIKMELGTQPTIIATGGLAPLFCDAIDDIEKVDETLILRGLLSLYQDIKST